MFSSHPFLYIDRISVWRSMRWGTFSCLFKIRTEVLKQSNFLLEFFRILSKIVSRHYILLLSIRNCFSFKVKESVSIRINYYLCRIIKKHSSWTTRKKVAKSILWWIVYPFLNPTCRTCQSLIFEKLLVRINSSNLISNWRERFRCLITSFIACPRCISDSSFKYSSSICK